MLLRKLSGPVQSDVMADGRVSALFKIPTHRPASLGANVSIDQGQLLNAFRQILAGKKPKPLKDNNDVVIDATITFSEIGTATIKIGTAHFTYRFAGLLSPTPAKRLKLLNGYLKDFTVSTSVAAALRTTVRKTKFSEDDFISVVSDLQYSHENWIENLRSTARSRDLNSGDFLPADLGYWDNLIAPRDASDSLTAYLAHERLRELNSLLDGNIARALHATSLSFCAPSLVPVEKLKELPKADLLKALENLATLPDHFALIGFFEICAALRLDERVEALGTRLLNALFNMESLKSQCAFFAAVFAMTLARLAEHTTLRNKPPYWRRITAAANASLVLRACGSNNAESVFKFVMQNYGKTFLLSVLLETDREPRWRPDWVTSNHFIADTVGRAEQALQSIPRTKRPKDWSERLAVARKWVSERHLDFFSTVPSIGESARREAPTKKEVRFLKPQYEAFASNPTVSGLLACGLGIFTVGVTLDVVRACRTLIERFQKNDVKWTDENVQYAIQVLSFVATLSRDTKLADLIADYCVGKVRDNQDDDATLEIVARLIECASADIDRSQACQSLASRLEAVAFLAPVKALPDFCDTILRLQALDSGLAPQLGRALSSSRLGVNAA